MTSVALVVPWRPDPQRQQVWDWLKARYRNTRSDWQIIEAPGRPGRWCKAWAVYDTLHVVTADVVVVADADVWCDGLSEAISAVDQGAAWAIPHLTVHRLTEHAGFDVGGELEQRPYRGTEGGGLVVLPTATLRDVPLDPRFQGWGGEDHAWACALHTLAGQPWRGSAPLYHFWHPPQPETDRFDRKFGDVDNTRLHKRYMGGCHDVDRITKLVNEAKELLWTSSSSSTAAPFELSSAHQK